MDRYFVVITARDPQALAGLRDLGLDLFPATGQTGHGRPSAVEGLLTLEQVERLRQAGYHVTVSDRAETRERARRTADFQAWRRAVEEE